MWDKKKALEAMMSKRKEGGGERIAGPTSMKPEHVSTEAGEPDMKHMAAQDMMHHFTSGSADGLRQSMENFIDLHMSEKRQESEPEPKK